jgi:hypothetical protein
MSLKGPGAAIKKKAAIKGQKQEETPRTMSVAMQQLMLPLLVAVDATKKGLLSFVQQMGMVVLSDLLTAEAAKIAGPKGRVGTACVVGSSRNKHEPDSGTLPTIGYTTPTELVQNKLCRADSMFAYGAALTLEAPGLEF